VGRPMKLERVMVMGMGMGMGVGQVYRMRLWRSFWICRCIQESVDVVEKPCTVVSPLYHHLMNILDD
jgi:hypothetical protein